MRLNYLGLLAILFCIISTNLFSQSNSKRGEIAVQNPTTAEFLQRDLTGVSQYTGKANIGVPLHSMNFDGKEIGFNLSYDSGGVRVNEEASWVGLNWSLSGIPVISHIINQSSDVGSKRPGDNPPSYKGYCYEEEIPEVLFNSSDPTYYNYLISQYSGTSILVDTQPDFFVANLFGRVIKFELTQENADPSGRIFGTALNNSNATIEFFRESHSFEIIDEDGFTYTFDRVEYATSWSESDSASDVFGQYALESQIKGGDYTSTYFYAHNSSTERDVPTAWYVSKVTSPNSKVLDFEYFGEDVDKFCVSASNTQHMMSRNQTICTYTQNSGDTDPYFTSRINEHTLVRSIQINKLPREVINRSTGERVVFKEGVRNDIFKYRAGGAGVPNGFDIQLNLNSTNIRDTPKLNEIEVFASSGERIKEIKFGHSYFNGGVSAPPNIENENWLRLKLDQVTIDKDEYNFTYEQENNLPKKNSPDKDFWGYYNGAGNTRDEMFPDYDPSVPVTQCSAGNPQPPVEGGMLGSDFDFGKIGSLTSMSYPTGGYTSYEYDSHSVRWSYNQFNPETSGIYTHDYLRSNNLETGFPIASTINSSEDIFKIGGLRIKSVSNFDSDGAPLLRKDYIYDNLDAPPYFSSGKLMDRLFFSSLRFRFYQGGNAQLVDIIIGSNNRVMQYNSAMGSHVGYDKVEEVLTYADNTSQDNGRIITEFINKPNLVVNGNGDPETVYTPDGPTVNYEDGNGSVETQMIFKNNNTYVTKIENEYDYINENVSDAYIVYYGHLTNFIGGNNIPATSRIISQAFKYPTRKYISLLKTTVSTANYGVDGEVITTTEREYWGNTNHIYSQEVFNSSGGPSAVTKTEYFYPYSTLFNVHLFPRMNTLYDRNRIDKPVYTREYSDGRLISHSLDTYSFQSGLLLPEEYRWQTEDAPLGDMKTEYFYRDYDNYGNPTEIERWDGISNSFIWGYERDFPIAQITNSTISAEAIEDKLDNAVLQNPKSTDAQIRAELDVLRSDNDLKDSQIMSYTYRPGYGMTSQKSVQGILDTYEYDSQKRLIKSRDLNGKLTQEVSYNRIDESNDCLDCGRRIIVQAGYLQYVNSAFSFGRQTLGGSNGESFSGFNSYRIDYGDGTIASGGGIPNSYTHTYDAAGLYTIRLYAYHPNGTIETGHTNVRVVSDAMPGGDVYIDNITPPNGSAPRSGTLKGDVGALVDFSVIHGGDTSSHSGSVYIQGYGTIPTSSTGGAVTGQVQIISGGNSVSVTNNGGTSGFSTVTLKFCDTNTGQIVNPSIISVSN